MPRHDTPTITQFTDPMCTWCWGSEPVRQRLRTTFGDQVEFRFVLGGFVEDFETFYDAANDISEPGDVAPHWEEASAQHGMPVDTAIFETNPAQSTYPASEAVGPAVFTGLGTAVGYQTALLGASGGTAVCTVVLAIVAVDWSGPP